MKKAGGLYLGIGLIMMAITLIIFFVPRMNELHLVGGVEWTKLGIILTSQIIFVVSLIVLSRSQSMFSIFTISTISTFWFIINLIVTLVIRTLEPLIIWTSVIFLIYVAILLILNYAGGAVQLDEARERKLMEESKKKNLLKK